eukprot:6206922-Pleurochrysis_carterae.AAC.3
MHCAYLAPPCTARVGLRPALAWRDAIGNIVKLGEDNRAERAPQLAGELHNGHHRRLVALRDANREERVVRGETDLHTGKEEQKGQEQRGVRHVLGEVRVVHHPRERDERRDVEDNGDLCEVELLLHLHEDYTCPQGGDTDGKEAGEGAAGVEAVHVFEEQGGNALRTNGRHEGEESVHDARVEHRPLLGRQLDVLVRLVGKRQNLVVVKVDIGAHQQNQRREQCVPTWGGGISEVRWKQQGQEATSQRAKGKPDAKDGQNTRLVLRAFLLRKSSADPRRAETKGAK